MDQNQAQPSGDAKQALARAVERDGRGLQRFAAACLGRSEGRRVLSEVLSGALAGGPAEFERARLFEALRRRVAQQQSRARRGATGEVRGQGPLDGLRPTERESLLLRYVAGLPIADVAAATGIDDGGARERLSRGVFELATSRADAPRPAPAGSEGDALRARVKAELADVVDGLAPDELADFIAGDDASRDLVHDAERAVAELSALEADLEVEPDELVRSALEGGGAVAEESPPAAPREAVHEEAPEIDAAGAPGANAGALEGAASTSAPAAAGDAPARPALETPKAKGGAPAAVAAFLGRVGPRGRAVLAVSAVAALGALVFGLSRSGPERTAHEAWSGKVKELEHGFGGGSGLERCSPERAACAAIEEGDDVPAGSTLRTDGRTRAVVELADGTRLVVDPSTELVFDGDAPRRARVEHGGLTAEIPEIGSSRARIDVPLGFIEAGGVKLALDADSRRVAVEVVRGSLRLVDEQERGIGVHAGEEGFIRPGSPPEAGPSATLGRHVLKSERAFAARDPGEAPLLGLGELRAQKPGEDKERKGAVILASHSTKVRISGNVARTEIEEEFTNTTGDVLEGIFRFPLPPDAQIERLALDVDGKLEDGAFVDRDRAAAIWRGAIVNAGAKKPVEEIVWVPGPWRDPALLEWQRGGRFELRIYPIPKKGSRKIVLAYTEVLAPSGADRRYVYPLPHDPSGSTRVGRFDVNVQVRGHDAGRGVRASGYDVRQEALPDGVASLGFSQAGFAPNGDLTVEFTPADAAREVRAFGYQPGPDEVAAERSTLSAARVAPPGGGLLPVSAPAGDVSGAGYVAFAVRPRLPRASSDAARSFALVVDSSRSMFGERYRRAAELAERLVGEADPRDAVSVLACDSTCREMGAKVSPGRDGAARVGEFLRGVTPEGGSDVAGAVRRARDVLGDAGGGGRIVYIGDGTPTIGAVTGAVLRREIRGAIPRDFGTVTTVAIGADADVGTLRAVADAGGGVLVPYTPGEPVQAAAYAVLGATYGAALSDVEVELPDGVVDVAPRRLASIPAGSEAIVVGRLVRPNVEGTLRLKGNMGGKPFEQRYPVRVEATTSKGNAFVPRLWAAAKIADLENDGDAESRKRAVALSGQFHVASRYTSLLVLESETMFRAFGLDRSRGVASWTGEDDARSTAADGEEEFAGASGDRDDLAPQVAASKSASLGGLGSSTRSAGSGFDRFEGSSGESGGRAMAAPAAAPAPAPEAKKSESAADEPFAPPPPAKVARESENMPSRPKAARRPAPIDPFELERDPGGGGGVLSVPPPRPRRMIPMRKIWERVGRIVTPAVIPEAASADAIARADRAAGEGEQRRDTVQKLYSALFLAGEIDRASQVAERWSEKDPLDPDALTARADVAAARGDRDLAIRILGSVVDVRPGDHKAQWRLARLHRWAGRAELGCRHSMAVAQIRGTDSKLLAEAVRCARDVGRSEVASDLLAAADEATRRAAESSLATPPADPSALSGDFRLEASWDGGDDLDLSMLGPDGSRVSWLGAPTKAVITARDVASTGREALALRGASPGDYVVEITRPRGHGGTLRGEVDITAAGDRRRVPFVLDGDRVRVALVKMTSRSRLVPL